MKPQRNLYPALLDKVQERKEGEEERREPTQRNPQHRTSFTSMGLTVMVKAESSQSISFSFPESWSRIVRWWAALIRNTPRMIMNTRKLTQTTITTVAVLGTTRRGLEDGGRLHS